MHDLAIEDLSSKELVGDIQMVYFLVVSAPRFVGTINTTPILRSTVHKSRSESLLLAYQQW